MNKEDILRSIIKSEEYLEETKLRGTLTEVDEREVRKHLRQLRDHLALFSTNQDIVEQTLIAWAPV